MLKLNIGVSKKVGEANYGSRGASASVELEAESALLEEPGKLRSRVQQLFGIVRAAVDDELRGSGASEPDRANGSNGQSGNGHSHNENAANGNGSNGHQGNGHQGKGRSATQSQVRALYAITNKQDRELSSLIWDRFHRQKAESLSITEASQLIDELKSQNGDRVRS